jgi:serine/threonine-protein kinase RsbT
VRIVTTDDHANAGDDELVPLAVAVIGESDVPHARILATDRADRMGLSRLRAHELATVVPEPANTPAFHAIGGGRISLTVEDDGPGIAHLPLAMTDGFTTSGGLGGGWPGSRRLINDFSIVSTFGQGKRVAARLWR